MLSMTAYLEAGRYRVQSIVVGHDRYASPHHPSRARSAKKKAWPATERDPDSSCVVDVGHTVGDTVDCSKISSNPLFVPQTLTKGAAHKRGIKVATTWALSTSIFIGLEHRPRRFLSKDDQYSSEASRTQSLVSIGYSSMFSSFYFQDGLLIGPHRELLVDCFCPMGFKRERYRLMR
jgi:hypothetical protein